MTRNQDVRLISSCTVRDYLNANMETVNLLPYGASNTTILSTTITSILAEAEIQESCKAGYVDSSDSLKVKLVFEATDTARKLITFAKFTKNLILLAEIRKAKSKLANGSKPDIIKRAQIISDRAQSNLAALPTYSINATTQSSLTTAISSFTAVLGKTGTGRTEHAQSTERLRILFKTLSTTITALSDAVETVRSTKVDFYKGFISAKKVPTIRTAKSMLKGTVVGIDGNAVADILINIFLLDKDGNPIQDKKFIIKKKSGKNGGFKVKNVSDGNYLAILKNLKYAEEQVNFSLAKGQVVKLKVVMKTI